MKSAEENVSTHAGEISMAGTVERQNALSYALELVTGGRDTHFKRGLSHPEAMRLAEGLQREGKIVRIMHEVAGGAVEVDRYPPR